MLRFHVTFWDIPKQNTKSLPKKYLLIVNRRHFEKKLQISENTIYGVSYKKKAQNTDFMCCFKEFQKVFPTMKSLDK